MTNCKTLESRIIVTPRTKDHQRLEILFSASVAGENDKDKILLTSKYTKKALTINGNRILHCFLISNLHSDLYRWLVLCLEFAKKS